VRVRITRNIVKLYNEGRLHKCDRVNVAESSHGDSLLITWAAVKWQSVLEKRGRRLCRRQSPSAQSHHGQCRWCKNPDGWGNEPMFGEMRVTGNETLMLRETLTTAARDAQWQTEAVQAVNSKCVPQPAPYTSSQTGCTVCKCILFFYDQEYILFRMYSGRGLG
jgi:hypothetical protein